MISRHSTRALEPYPDYKNTEVQWLGTVPAHWETPRLKSTVRNVVDQTTERHQVGGLLVGPIIALENVESWTGRIRRLKSDLSYDSQLKRFAAGDVLFGKLRPYLAKVARLRTGGLCVGEFLVLRPSQSDLLGQYLEQFLRSEPVIDAVNSSTFGAKMPRAEWQFMGGMAVLRPPISEQAAIVRFLDHADRRIRRYIRAKQKLIALLEEQRQTIIQQAVTGQIDIRSGKPYPTYKPGGAEWPGKVPKHWEVIRLGRLVNLTVGFPFKSEGFTQSDDDVRLLRGVNIAPGRIRWEDVVRWPVDDVHMFAEYRLHVGDLVLGMDRPIISDGIRMATVGQSDVPSVLLQRVARIRPGQRLITDFALLLLGGQSFYNYVTPIFTGISVPHLSPEQIKAFRFPLPSVAEQEAIVEELKFRTSSVQSALKATLERIALVDEYRTRLVADVVTGKLDVRVAVAALPTIDPLASDDAVNNGLDVAPMSAPHSLDTALEELEA